MARKWSDLRAKMSPERQARIDASTEALRLEMDLAERYRPSDLTPSDVPRMLEEGQAAISKLENGEDMPLLLPLNERF